MSSFVQMYAKVLEKIKVNIQQNGKISINLKKINNCVSLLTQKHEKIV